MKKLTILFLALCSYMAQAQITAYTNATIDNFRAIGGYAYFTTVFPNVQNPYSLSGPLPQNDFTFVATSPQGLTGDGGTITSSVPNQPITFTFKSNNVRKIYCDFLISSENIQITAITNLGNLSSVNGGTNLNSHLVGFNVQGENEYLTQVVFAAPIGVNTSIVIHELSIGDNTPQNTALNFDGINDHVSLHNTIGNFGASQSFTVTCWVKVAATQVSLANTDNAILEKWDGVAGAYPFVIRYLNSGPNAGKILARRYDGNESNSTVLISGGTINDGKWHHIAYVRESNGGLKLYIDGAFSNGDPDNVQNLTTNGSPLYVGSRNNDNHFKGKIDEVRLWTVGKTQTEIQNEMFCKNPNTTNLQAAFNFNNGSPNNDNRGIITVANSVNFSLPGILFNFAQTGDASNWVTGQVKYVKANATGSNNGSSWTNAFTNLQTALALNPCNDLFDVYVATGTYKPHASNTLIPFNVPSGMKIYGGFAGTEKNINERNMALIHRDNKTTLSGDLTGNDTPFNFASNRTENSSTVVNINGGYVTFDGFTVSGGQSNGIQKGFFGDVKISNSRIVDNNSTGLFLNDANSVVSNCVVVGNNADGIYMSENSTNFQNCVVVNNGGNGIRQNQTITTQSNFTNCTIASNGSNGIRNNVQIGGSVTNNIKNTIIKDNAVFGISNSGSGTSTYNITHSLVQGLTTGTGNLNGNTVNPQFVSPLGSGIGSNLGDYRLKDSSPCINLGDDIGVSPLDLERNPRPKGGKTDMGAYESNVNMNEIISIITGNWESNTTWNLNRIPLPTDKVIVNGHQVTVTTNTARVKDLEYKTGAILRYVNGGMLRFGL